MDEEDDESIASIDRSASLRSRDTSMDDAELEVIDVNGVVHGEAL